MLHEIGSFVNRAGRHRHAYYLIAHSEIFGYTTQQRSIVAAISGQAREELIDAGGWLRHAGRVGEQNLAIKHAASV